jgi:DNA-binding MarR family transcriptional regulator
MIAADSDLHARADSDDVRDADYAMLASFRHELRRFLHFSESAAATTGLTPQQYQALLAIRAAPGGTMPIGALAESLLLRPHSATGLLDRLERQALVERLRDDDDRRQVNVRLTGAGRRVLASLAANHRAELHRIRPLLTDLVARL